MRTLKGKDWLRDASFPFDITRGRVADSFPAHKHEFYEFFYMCAGRLSHYIDGQAREVTAGDIVLLNPSRDHAFAADEADGAERIQCIFMPSFLGVNHAFLKKMKSFTELIFMEPFYERGCMVFRLTGRTDLKVRTLLEELLEENTGKPKGYEIAIRTKLTDLFITISRAYEKQKEKNPRIRKQLSATTESIIDTLAYIEAHCTEPLTLEGVARDQAGVSKEYFCRVFRNITGTTFTHYLNGLRVAYAQKLLTGSDAKIIGVCLDAGFNDLSHFNRTFKQVTGQTPSAWRKAHGAS